jgi:hypothetical protein
MRPKDVVPVVAASISSGMMWVESSSEIITNSESRDMQLLSDEQRIKLAEALMFIIRRMATTNSFVTEITNLMIYGRTGERIDAQADSTSTFDATKATKIHDETRNYFLEVEDDIEQEKKEQWEEQDIRLKTGGPVFEMEETDVVRAARVAVIAELTSTSKPQMIAPNCRLFVRLVIDILRLDTSRAVFRAASLLARELYGCLLREQEELAAIVDSVESKEQSPLPLAVAMVSSDEELLVSVLQEYATHRNAGIKDAATASRCEEALALRKQADDEGIFTAAHLVFSQRHSNPVPSFLRAIHSNKASIIEIDKVESQGG